MIAFKKTATLCGMVVALALCSVSSSPADPASEVAAIQAVDQVWVKAYNGGDVDTVAGLYDENAVLLPPGAPAAHGGAAIRGYFAKDIPASAKAGLTFSLGPKPGGGVSGDMGWSSGTYTVKDKTGQVVETGKYLSVSRKKGGKWLYIRDAWNSDARPACPEAAAPAKK
jgi:ketosteroid isomerase-like protein